MEIIETGKSKKWILIVAAAIIVAALATYYFIVFKKLSPPVQNNTGVSGKKLPPGDTTVDINNALKAINLGNPQAEIKNIDPDINNL
ncbi:MAG: hypothetical protein Athens071426_390 [Parcubacteria group bacterium Athens0714_26]|nr:MAG: hypothetical protein Athens101426_130 [Parcubacteria group bacterium Athens1014_26]TSD02782.1 MAG: hypothetical protein Athens071426_390 [Parcubacteria group bacterium Athens0714_26]